MRSKRFGFARLIVALVVWTMVFLSEASAIGRIGRGTGSTNKDIYGQWRLAQVLGAADIAAMSDKEARALIGKQVSIGKDAFIFNGERCDAPSYERTTEDLVRSFREKGHASVAGLGLPDPVTEIDAGCTQIFLKVPGVLVLHWNGYYFQAVRLRQEKSR